MELILLTISLILYPILVGAIKSPTSKLFFGTLLAGSILMLIIPGAWHSSTDYQNIGFLGFDFSRFFADEISLKIYFSTIYVFSVCFILFWAGNKFFYVSTRIGLFDDQSIVFRYDFSTLFLLLCLSVLYFYLVYGGSIGGIFSLRTRSTESISVFFEVLRGSAVVLAVFSLIKLLRIKSRLKPVYAMFLFFVFVLSLILIFGSGSRNLLVYPLLAYLVWVFFDNSEQKVGSKVISGGIILSVILSLALLQSVFRDFGLWDSQAGANDFSKLFLAFDQYSGAFLAFSTANDLPFTGYSLPFKGFTDIFMHYIPANFLGMFGFEKTTYAGYDTWNAYVVGQVNSNVTPSMIGQFYIEDRFWGVFQLPFIIFSVSLILFKISIIAWSRSKSFDVWLSCLALLAGGLFNSIRFFGGAYFFYLVLFLVVVFSLSLIRYFFVRLE